MTRLARGIFALSLCFFTLAWNVSAAVRLDPAFGQGGTLVTQQFSIADHTRRLRVQPDGSLLALATSTIDRIGVPRAAAIFRYNSTGQRDLNFGTGSSITIEGLRDFDLLPDGRIVVVITDYGLPAAARVCRFSANGVIDNGFGALGCVVAAGPGRHEGRKIRVQSDGRIVIVGMTEGGGFAARITADGNLDPSFDSDGMAYGWGTDFSYSLIPPWTLDSNGDIAIQPDGKIVYGLGGGWGQFYYLARLNSDGSIDKSFGDGSGLVTSHISVPGYPYDTFSFGIEAQPNGNLLAIGTAIGWNGDSNWNIVRFNSNGGEVDSFEASSADSRGPASAIVVLSDGRIVLGGMKDKAFALTRLNQDLSIDATFGDGGVFKAPFGTPDSATSILSMAFTPSGKLIVAGSVIDDASLQNRVGLAQFLDVDSTSRKRTPFDFDGDGKADQGVYRDGIWYLRQSTDGVNGFGFGLAGDQLTAADYDGDGRTDPAIYREGVWWVLNSNGTGHNAIQWGIASDIPVAADYDGDGKADRSVYRDGTWWILFSSGAGYTTINWGIAGDKPVPADYDGDGKADFAVYRNGEWWILFANGSGYNMIQSGTTGDIPVPADYDGDGRANIAFYRQGEWSILNTMGQTSTTQWGEPGDIPVPADYNGDGRTDISIYRTGEWWTLYSNGYTNNTWGIPNDVPVPGR